MKQYKIDFIHLMLDANVLMFGDFTTKSGRKTPFFINAGNFCKGQHLSKLGAMYADAIVDNYKGYDVLFGPAYKGIPIVVATAIELSRKFDICVEYCSNRKELKTHGDAGILLGGKLKNSPNILMVEDVTTAGTSIYETMPIIQAQSEGKVLGLIIAVDRMEKGVNGQSALAELKEKFAFKTSSIVTMREVFEYLKDNKVNGKKIITADLEQAIIEYYNIYGATF